MAVLGAEPHGELPSERVAKAMLPKVLDSFDMVAISFYVCALLGGLATLVATALHALGRRTAHAGTPRPLPA